VRRGARGRTVVSQSEAKWYTTHYRFHRLARPRLTIAGALQLHSHRRAGTHAGCPRCFAIVRFMFTHESVVAAAVVACSRESCRLTVR
jgi:hypothetical protein